MINVRSTADGRGRKPGRRDDTIRQIEAIAGDTEQIQSKGGYNLYTPPLHPPSYESN